MKANRENVKKFLSSLRPFIAAVVVGGSFGIAAVYGQEHSISTNSAWTAPARAARQENPVAADQKSVAQGKKLYSMGCLACHGSAGKGDGPVAATLERNGVPIRPGNLSDPKLWEQTDGALFWKISQGNTPMPAWGEILSEDQRWTVINYVRTLAPRAEKTNTVAKSGGN